MWFQIFKIKLRDAILILLISIPMGYFIYNRNVSKINYVIRVESGILYNENYCEKYSDIGAPSILNNSDLKKITDILNTRLKKENSTYNSRVYLNYAGVSNPYEILIAGKDFDLDKMVKLVEFSKNIFAAQEMHSFDRQFSKIKIICQGKSYPVFAFLPPNNQSVEGSVRYAYSKNFLYMSAFGPFLALYLLMLLYKLIRTNRFVKTS
jgi:hypothetical protein